MNRAELLRDAKQLLNELEWYANRKKDLAAPVDTVDGSNKVWADLMLSELKDLRKLLDELEAR